MPFPEMLACPCVRVNSWNLINAFNKKEIKTDLVTVNSVALRFDKNNMLWCLFVFGSAAVAVLLYFALMLLDWLCA